MALTGDLSIVTTDGTVLTASTDLTLAWKWATHEHGDDWPGMTWGERNASVGLALRALRDAYKEAGE